MKTIIVNGNLVFPEKKEIVRKNLVLENGRISGFSGDINHADNIIDATGLFVFPGFIDIHAHFRDPGLTYKENIESGLKAAARGGMTSVVCMPNTQPPLCCTDVISDLKIRSEKAELSNLLVCGCATRDRNGNEIYDYDNIYKYICAVSDDGNGIPDERILEEVLEQCRKYNLVYMSHCQNPNIDPHIPESEETFIAREILYSKKTGARVHIQHVSTEFSLELIRLAKRENLNVTCEVCPHHIFLDDSIIDKTGKYRINPPLRKKDDNAALIKGISDGTIDVISSDHAPHSPEEKNCPYKEAMPGVSGIEIMAEVCFTGLMEKGISPELIADKFTSGPAGVLQLKERGALIPGNHADITIMDLKKGFTIKNTDIVSKGKNIAFDSFRTSCGITHTIVGGRTVWQREYSGL